MIADFMFSLNFLPGHLQLSWWCWLCALSTWQHHVKIALRRRRFDWLWLHRLWFTWCFHWISSRTSTASWWCCLWLCGLSTRQRRVKISLRRRRFDWLWLHRLWFTLIHWIFFQDIYGKLVMLALALCALHTIASWENRTEAEALCTDFDSLATNCFAVFPGQLTHTHTHLLYFLTCHELWVVGPKQDASNMSNHKCFKVNKRISTESESNSMIWASLNHQDDVQASSNIWASSKS